MIGVTYTVNVWQMKFWLVGAYLIGANLGFSTPSYAQPSIHTSKRVVSVFKELKKRTLQHKIATQLFSGWTEHPSAHRSLSLSMPPRGVAASLRTRKALSKREIQQLEHKGIQFIRTRKGLLSLGTIYPIQVMHPHALLTLAQNRLVVRVEDTPKMPPMQDIHPLSMTSANIQATNVYKKTHKDKRITGKGITIGLIDSGINIFHPLFFKADGGYFVWIDVNKDGEITAGVDGVDLNTNGNIESNELLRCLVSGTYNGYLRRIDARTGHCRAGVDWFYIDRNNNQKRDFGTQAGYKESDPAYGEPIFIIDDVNRNGHLDLHEKLIALKTSKVKATYILGVERQRGRDLILTSRENENHGTASASVLAGGILGKTLHTGIAPDAELVVASTRSTNPRDSASVHIVRALAWVIKEKVDVVLHEYVYWFFQFLDGSSNLEQALEQHGKQGIIQVVPAGNLGGSKKHMKVELLAGQTATYPILVTDRERNYKYRQMGLTLLWRQVTPSPNLPALKFSLVFPNGTEYPFTSSLPVQEQIPNTKLFVRYLQETSSRNTRRMDVTLFAFDQQTQKYLFLPEGKWQIKVTADPKQNVVLHGYIYDDRSSWGPGIQFAQHATDAGLAGWPATADTALVVGAYTGYDHPDYSYTPEKKGQMRAYSSPGPRIDGKAMMWLSAPDNPVTAGTRREHQGRVYITDFQYRVFGGTSGASPHVAGAAALLKQMHPDWDQKQVKEAFRKGALVDADVGTAPNSKSGHGKVRIYRTLFGKDPQSNTAPTIQYTGKNVFYVGQLPKKLQVVVADKETPTDKLQLRWDLRYEGKWSSEPTTAQIPFSWDQKGQYQLKAQVTDTSNASSSVLIAFSIQACTENAQCHSGFVCKEGICVEPPKPEPVAKEPTPKPNEPTLEPQNEASDAGTTTPETELPKPGCGCYQGKEQSSMLWLWGLLLMLGGIQHTRRRLRS